ncbi:MULTISPECIES: hypothetical protein [unclassified Helicobacter]|uniref:hypothetical protein n=1 Tax=unclassified Helicobacter TaxID=2593540 RepID=UPI0012E94143|nr:MULTISPECIES: hypothetical protein [unclassified Helicobacter]
MRGDFFSKMCNFDSRGVDWWWIDGWGLASGAVLVSDAVLAAGAVFTSKMRRRAESRI